MKNINAGGPVSKRSVEHVAGEDQESNSQYLRFTYRHISTYTIEGCAYYCLLDTKCKSFNYLTKSNSCEINSAARDLENVDEEEWIDYEGIWIKIYRGLYRLDGAEYRNRKCFRITDDVEYLENSLCIAPTCSDSAPSCSMVPFLHAYTCIQYQKEKSEVMSPWSRWGSWTPCTATCGTSYQTRSRICDNQEIPWFCSEHDEEKQLCATNPCPIWSHWDSWTECSTAASCGKGARTRKRSCLNGGVPNVDPMCTGDVSESDDCYVPSCQAMIRIANLLEGVVQVLEDSKPFGNEWKDVCEDDITDMNAVTSTVCQQLGLGVPHMNKSNTDSGQFKTHLSVTSCDAFATQLMECEHIWKVNDLCSKRLQVHCSGGPNEAIVCQSKSSLVQCTAGLVLSILSAEYGNRDGDLCDSGVDDPPCVNNVTNMIYDACDGKKYCVMQANRITFGCQQQDSYLRIEYKCIEEWFPWSAWTSWSICDRFGSQRRKKERMKKEELEMETDNRTCVLEKGVTYEGWFPGDNSNEYKILEGPYSTIHTARMECRRLNADILTDDINHLPANRWIPSMNSSWFGAVKPCKHNCSWVKFNGEDASNINWDQASIDWGFHCARIHPSFEVTPSLCEFAGDEGIGVICQKKTDEQAIEYQEGRRLVIFDDLSFSHQRLRAAHWTTQNSHVLCQQFRGVSYKENGFLWKNEHYIPIAANAFYAKSLSSDRVRCQLMNGHLVTFSIADLASANIPPNFDTANFRDIVNLNYKHCVGSTDAECIKADSGGYQYFCKFEAGSCKELLGEEAYVTASSSVVENDVTNLIMNWPGMTSTKPLETCHGWRPNEYDEEPYLVLEFRDTVEITGLQLARSYSSNERLSLEVWYSLDGHTWLGTKSVLEPLRFKLNHHRKTVLFGSSKSFRLIASSIKIKSSTKIEHSCLQMEVFGCKVDAELDLKCSSVLRVKDLLKSDPVNDNEAVDEYFKKSYYKISNNHKSLWIPKYTKQLESCKLGTLEQNFDKCPWWEMQLGHTSYISKIAMQGLSFHNKPSCSILSFIVAYNNDEESDDFKMYSSKLSRHPRIFHNDNEETFTNHRLANVFAKRIRIIVVQWTNKPCGGVIVHGCSLTHFLASVHGLPPHKNIAEQKSVIWNYNCVGNEEKLDLCPHERDYLSKAKSTLVEVKCKERYALEGSMKRREGYVKIWNNFQNSWQPLTRSLYSNDSEAILHWNLANSWSEDDEMEICSDMNLQQTQPAASAEIPSSKFATISSKSNAIYRNKRDGKLVTALPKNILQSSNTDLSNQESWCPLRFGEYLTYEFKNVFQISELEIIPLAVKEKGKIENAQVIEYVVQYSTQKDSWINVPSQNEKRTIRDHKWKSSYQNPLTANRVRAALTKFPVGYKCFSMKFYGKEIMHGWQLHSLCMEPLGVQDGRIADERITASSIFNTKFAAKYGRLSDGIDSENNKGWACHCMDEARGTQWIQVETNNDMNIRGIVTQGAASGNYFVKSYKVAYSNGFSGWTYVRDDDGQDMIFQGNGNAWTKVVNYFPKPVIAQYVRIYPLTYHNYIIFRFELLGCWARRSTFILPVSSIPPAIECYKLSDSGASYRGSVAQTLSGYTCQAWSSQSPHGHLRTPEKYPLAGLGDNYCRNPDGASSPWCYTTSSAVRFEFCRIPVCSDLNYVINSVTTVVKGNYEFWLVSSGTSFPDLEKEHDRKSCQIGGGDLVYKVFMLHNGSDVLKEVAADFDTILNQPSLYGIGLTDNLLWDLYQDDDQTVSIGIGSGAWHNGKPSLIQDEHYIGAGANGLVDVMKEDLVSWLCERVNKSPESINNARCPHQYTWIEGYCYKAITADKFQSCNDMLDYCYKEGSVGFDFGSGTETQNQVIEQSFGGNGYRKICDLNSFYECHENNGSKVMCSKPSLYTICQQKQEFSSLLTENDSNKNMRMEQFTASSYQMSNPPWLASPGKCSSFCFDIHDHERWIQVDLQELHYVNSVTSYPPNNDCASKVPIIVEDINIEISTKALKIQLVMMTDFQGSTLNCYCIFHIFSDGSQRCQFLQPVLGRFVKIVFEKSVANTCVTVDIKGEKLQETDFKWLDGFMPADFIDTGFADFLTLQTDTLDLCARECVKNKINTPSTCVAMTYDNSQCKLFTSSKDSSVNFQTKPYISKSYLLDALSSKYVYSKGVGASCLLRKIPGSQTIGCFHDNSIHHTILIHHSPTLPWDCTEECFSQGYENAIVKLGGYCYCGNVDVSASKLSVNAEEHCNIPCVNDASTQCGGMDHGLVYQKPVRCLKGHFASNQDLYYCMHRTRKDFYAAERGCKNHISNEEILNPFVDKDTLQFVEKWVQKLAAYATTIGAYTREMRIWCGKLRDISVIPPWVHWSINHPGSGSDECVVLVVVIGSVNDLVSAVLETEDCNTGNHFYICNLGSCDDDGNCVGALYSKESQQKIEFVNIKAPITWHEGREICLQQNKDLCLAHNICSQPEVIFATTEAVINSAQDVWIPIRDTFKDWVHVNNLAPYYCVPASLWTTTPLSHYPSNPTARRRLFCCDKDNRVPVVASRNVVTLGKKKHGPIRLMSMSRFAVTMTWVKDDCCSDCFVATSVKMPSEYVTEFYLIYKNDYHNESQVYLEMVDAPGYYLSYCGSGVEVKIVAMIFTTDDSRFVFKRQKEENQCWKYSFMDKTSHYVTINASGTVASSDGQRDICVKTSDDITSFTIRPTGLMSWQYSRDFCNLRGMDLCTSNRMCDLSCVTGMWYPNRMFYNSWGYSHANDGYGLALWGRHQGECRPFMGLGNDLCTFKGILNCCGAVKYLEDNDEDPVHDISFTLRLGQAVEYGYLNDFNDVTSSGDGSGLGGADISVVTEEECFDMMRSEGYFAYVISKQLKCIGMDREQFHDALPRLSVTDEELQFKIVKINVMKYDNKSHVPYLTNGTIQTDDWRFVGSNDFSISLWYIDIDRQGGKLISYIDGSTEFFNMELVRIGDMLILYYCKNKYTYTISAYNNAPNLIWHNVVVTYKHNTGIGVYMDGSRLYEDFENEMQQYCLLPQGEFILLPNATNSSSSFAVFFDVWDHTLQESLIRNHYSGMTQFGNVISSNFANDTDNSTHFILPPEALQLNFWTRKPTFGFTLSYESPSGEAGDVTSELTIQSQSLMMTVQNRSSYITPCASSDAHPLHQSCEYSNTFQMLYDFEDSKLSMARKFTSVKYFANFVNLGNGTYKFEGLEEGTAETSLAMHHTPGPFTLSKIKQTSIDTSSFYNFREPVKLTLNDLSCWVSTDSPDDSFYRKHHTSISRTCLRQEWINIGCKVPLFQYGSFFDYLVERWRRSGVNGGIGLDHIRELFYFAKYGAKTSSFKYYQVCYGGYTVRLLRTDQKLDTMSVVPPTESMRSGLLQFYDNYYGWGVVCISDITNKEFATVACKQLGYAGLESVQYIALTQSSRVTLKNPVCFGNESTLDDCRSDRELSCDGRTQAVHITCKAEWGYCNIGFKRLTTGVCVSSKITVKSKNEAEEECKAIGGILPEPRSGSVRELLPVELDASATRNVWLGTETFGGKIVWSSTGDDITKSVFQIGAITDANSCISFDESMEIKLQRCDKPSIDAICVEHINCPGEYSGTECELVDCPEQELNQVDYVCSSKNQNSLHVICSYNCIGNLDLIGPNSRKCIMDPDYGPVWDQVDPLCTGAPTPAVELCENRKACGNYGTCIATSHTTYRCECPSGFGGPNCRKLFSYYKSLPTLIVNPCTYKGCLNYGTCTSVNKEMKCTCLPGYSGEFCENFESVLCASNPCLNGGSCAQTGSVTFICRCPHEYTGNYCEHMKSSFGPTGCTFPFVYEEKKYFGCTSDGMINHAFLGCYEASVASFIQVDIGQYDSEWTFAEGCFQATYDRGHTGFGLMTYDGQRLCFGFQHVLQSIAQFKASSDCQEGILVYRILHENIGRKWCSVDKFVGQDWLYCHTSEDSILLGTTPLKESRKILRKHCYQRRSAPFKSAIFDEFSFYINEILSCVHSGQKMISTAVLQQGSDRNLVKSDEPCDFLVQRDFIPYYRCFNSPDTANDLMKMCYNNFGNLTYCIEHPTKLYEPCKNDDGDVGHALSTLVGGTSPGMGCKFPFDHGGETISSCKLGWCYTDDDRNWTYCIQESCEGHPNPLTSALQMDGKPTSQRTLASCDTLADHQFLGRGTAPEECEMSCSEHALCNGYIFLPEFPIFVTEKIMYSLHKQPMRLDEAKQVCLSLGATLLTIDDEIEYTDIVSNIESLGMSDLKYWIMMDNGCATFNAGGHSYQSSDWNETVDCDLFHPFICQKDPSYYILESVAVGKIPSTLGYCIGVTDMNKLKNIPVSSTANNGTATTWWAWKHQCDDSPVVAGDWTDWFNINIPYATGEFEDLKTLASLAVSGFPCDYPIDMEFRYSGSDSIILDENEKVFSHNHLGVVCLESNLNSSEDCPDYEVRYLCRFPDGSVREPLTGRKWEMSEDPANWTEASRTCKSLGGKLAVVDSYEIEKLVKDFIDDEDTCDGVYIGLKSDLTEWVDGSFVRYHRVDETTSDTECVIVNCGHDSVWEIVDCGILKTYICEFSYDEFDIVQQQFTMTDHVFRVKVENDSQVFNRIAPPDKLHCMKLCHQAHFCRGVLVDDNECLLLSGYEGLIVTSPDVADYRGYFKLHKNEYPVHSVIDAIGSILVTVSDMHGSETESSTFLQTGNTQFTFGTDHHDDGTLIVSSDLFVAFKIYALQLRWELTGDAGDLPIRSVMLSYRTDADGPWKTEMLSRAFNKIKIWKVFDVPIIARYIKLSEQYTADEFENNERLISISFSGVPLTEEESQRLPHGHHPPGDEFKDAITARCED